MLADKLNFLQDIHSVQALVVGLHLRWNGVWQRPNHVLVRLAKLLPVLVVEEPFASETNEDALASYDGLTVLTPYRIHSADSVDAPVVAAARTWVAGRSVALWLYSPMMLPLADAFPGAPIVYDKMDHLAAFLDADPRLGARENEVLARAAAVFAGGPSLWRTVAERARHGRSFPSGVDAAHFARALSEQPHPSLRGFGPPIFGYIGVIDERLDLALIAYLADSRPAATIVLAGPVVKIDPSSLPRRPNIVYLGQRSYAELPSLLGGIDVALMPFTIGPATQFISPTKTLEYLAAGRPVVSTPVPDVVDVFGDVVRIADSPQAFVAAVAEAERDRKGARETGRARAADSSWDAIVAAMLAELRDAGVRIEADLPAAEST
jgi:glycosyltransferase involved in cell wall biosynthesis